MRFGQRGQGGDDMGGGEGGAKARIRELRADGKEGEEGREGRNGRVGEAGARPDLAACYLQRLAGHVHLPEFRVPELSSTPPDICTDGAARPSIVRARELAQPRIVWDWLREAAMG